MISSLSLPSWKDHAIVDGIAILETGVLAANKPGRRFVIEDLLSVTNGSVRRRKSLQKMYETEFELFAIAYEL